MGVTGEAQREGEVVHLIAHELEDQTALLGGIKTVSRNFCYPILLRSETLVIMTTLELKLSLPERLAKEAQAAGLLTPQAITQLVKEAVRRRAGQALLDAAERVAQADIPPLSVEEIQAEVNAVRQARKTDRPV